LWNLLIKHYILRISSRIEVDASVDRSRAERWQEVEETIARAAIGPSAIDEALTVWCER
jgi:hypothetical protein